MKRQRRGRPARFESETDKEEAREFSKRFARELKESSNMTVSQLVEVLDKYGQGPTEPLFRQYLCGDKIIGKDKMKNLALIAVSKNWHGDCIERALKQEGITYELHAGKIEQLENLFLEILSPSSIGYEIEDLDKLIQLAKISAIQKAEEIYCKAQDEYEGISQEEIEEKYLITKNGAFEKPKFLKKP